MAELAALISLCPSPELNLYVSPERVVGIARAENYGTGSFLCYRQPVNVTLALLWTRAAAPLSVATFPVPRYNFGAQASGNADKFKGFAEECMAEYDLDG